MPTGAQEKYSLGAQACSKVGGSSPRICPCFRDVSFGRGWRSASIATAPLSRRKLKNGFAETKEFVSIPNAIGVASLNYF
jgi:hypothetical protein